MSSATRGTFLLQLIIPLLVTLCSAGAFAATSGFIPAANRTDMVYDDARGVLYITDGTRVLRYQPATDSFLAPYTFNLGNLSGIDLAPDGSTLAVADRNVVGIHLIDLASDEVRPDLLFTASSGESGTHSVAFGADGALLVSSRFNGSGSVPLRRVDPATGAVTVVKEYVGQDSMLSASGDRACIAYEESNASNGPISIYQVATGSVTRTASTDWFTFEIGANRNCTQFAVPTYGGTFIYDGSLNKTGTVGTYAGAQPIGVAYHPTRDIVYFAWAKTRELHAYDSNTSEELAVFDTGYAFQHTGNWGYNQGRLKTSRDGRLLFATVGGGVYWVNTSLDPVADDLLLATGGNEAAALTLTGNSPKGAALSYSIVTPPAHGTLEGTPPQLAYTAAAGYSGRDSFTFKVSDGSRESAPATVSISVDREAPAVAAFSMPASSSFLSVAVTSFGATDNERVTGYCLSESASSGLCFWSETPPTSYRFNGPGPQTVYAFAKDAAGNVSEPQSAAVEIQELLPWISAFSIPPTYHYGDLSIPVTLTAGDDLGGVEYCITEGADHAGCVWSSWPPSSYAFAAPGPHTLHAFARNGSGKVSAPATASTNVVGEVNAIPAPGRVDMAHDGARNVVYVSSGSSLMRYHIATQSFLAPISFANASLAGMDIAPDGKTLAVADRNKNGVHLVDLETGTAKPDVLFAAAAGESGTHSVAFGADGALLATSRVNGSGWVPLRRIDPATGAVTVVKSSIGQDAMLSASGDGACIAYEESNGSNGPVSVYDVAAKTVTKRAETGWFTYEVAANRDCTQFAVPTYGGTFILDGNLARMGALGEYAGKQPIGAAFTPAGDQVFFAWAGTREVRSYDTANYEQLASYDMGHTFTDNGNYAYKDGRMKVARDGSLFMVSVQGGVRYQRVSVNGAPVADDQGVTAYAGSPLPVNLAGSRTPAAHPAYTITVSPSHGTLTGTAPNLVYTPVEGYSGPDSFSFRIVEGEKQSNEGSFAITVRQPPTNVRIAPPTVNGVLSLSWDNPADPDFSHIHIYRSTEPGRLGTLIADNLADNSYTDTGLPSLTTFYYTVRWADVSGIESTNVSQVSQRTMDATAPVTSASPPGGSYSGGDAGIMYPTPQHVTLSCNDGAGDGCAATYYCLGNGCTPATPYQGAILISSSGVLRFYSVDQAGNSEQAKTAAYQILPRFVTLPEEVSLGATLLYYPAARTVTIGNAGTLPVTVTAPISVIGPDSAQFGIAPGGPSPCPSLSPTIAAGKSCTFTVSFLPDTAGDKQAFLQVTSDADNAPTGYVSLTGTGLPAMFLTVEITGKGTVNNIAPSAPLSCAASTCTAPYAAGSPVTLRGTPSSGYTFSGWTGGACSGTADCELTLTSHTTVGALFSILPRVRIGGTNADFSDFTSALKEVASPGIVKARNLVIADNILLSSGKTVTVLGGLKEDFTAREGVTTLDGSITIRKGCLRVRYLAVR